MRPAADLLESGRLAIVQGVGYPNPNRSHFESMNIWQTARTGKAGRRGAGLARPRRSTRPRTKTGRRPSSSATRICRLRCSRGERRRPRSPTHPTWRLTLPPPPGSPADSGDDLAAFVNRTVTSAYATAGEIEAASARGRDPSARYPETVLAKRLELVARSIKAGSTARVFYVIQPGYDSHAVQLPTQAQLLREFAGAVKAFLDDLAASKLAGRVLLLAFSEFGRRPEENGSLGTDHGTAGPVFLAGESVKPGVAGKTPLLGDLEDGNLKWSTDFRSVYATLLSDWLDLPADEILGRKFPGCRCSELDYALKIVELSGIRL